MNPDELAELEEQRAFLLRSLDDLDRELRAGDIDELDASTLRADYTHRLAEVQRTIEGGRATIAEEAPPRRLGRKIAAGVVVAGLAAGAGLVVANAAGSRKAGDTATGNTGNRSFEGLLSEAATLLNQGKALEALRDYDTVLKQDPNNVEALANRGFIIANVAAAGGERQLLTEAESTVRRALALAPREPFVLYYLGLIQVLQADKDGARKSFDDALAGNPPDTLRTKIQASLDQLDTSG